MSVSFRDAFGKRDIFLLTLDALRFDVARDTLAAGLAPNLTELLGINGFEPRDTPATFTYAAHHAFFSGFLPTSKRDPSAARSIALRFPGSRSIGPSTLVLQGTSIPEALHAAGYHTICIGGTAFFNQGDTQQAALGTVLPSLFDEAHWSHEMGVTSPRASERQFALAAERLQSIPQSKRVFLFINASATHPPTRMHVRGAKLESTTTQSAALQSLDKHLPTLLNAIRARDGAVGIICSDHGTCFGEDGMFGHRVAHENVWTVPYAEVEIQGT